MYRGCRYCTGDRRILVIRNYHIVLAGLGPAMDIGYCPYYRRGAYRELCSDKGIGTVKVIDNTRATPQLSPLAVGSRLYLGTV